MSKETVLQVLLQERGDFLSGEAISQKIGVTRAAVWKYIVVLREQGYEIDSVRNRGYRLSSLPDRLEPLVIGKGLEQAKIGREILCFPTIDSTNLELRRRGMAGEQEGLVVIAEEQTAGKGRRGRSFFSPAGTGLYLSFLLRPSCSPIELAQLTPWVAVAVAEGIQACCNLTPSIKWTNDLLLDGKKLSGILTELVVENESGFVEYAVVGIGVNVNQQKEDFPQELQEMTTSLLQATGRNICRNELCHEILSALNRMISAFPQEKEPYLQRYRELCVTTGKEVLVVVGDSQQEAKALEIDDNFALLVEYPHGERCYLSSGEVSVRGICGYS